MRTYPVTYLFEELVLSVHSINYGTLINDNFEEEIDTAQPQLIFINKTQLTNIRVALNKAAYIKYGTKIYNATYNIDAGGYPTFSIPAGQHISALSAGGSIILLQPPKTQLYNQLPTFTDIFDYFKTTPASYNVQSSNVQPTHTFSAMGSDGLMTSKDKWKLDRLRYSHKIFMGSVTTGTFTEVLKAEFYPSTNNAYNLMLDDGNRSLTIKLNAYQSGGGYDATAYVSFDDNDVFGQNDYKVYLKSTVQKYTKNGEYRYILNVSIKGDMSYVNGYSDVSNHLIYANLSADGWTQDGSAVTVNLNTNAISSSSYEINKHSIKRTLSKGDILNLTRTITATDLQDVTPGVYNLALSSAFYNYPSTAAIGIDSIFEKYDIPGYYLFLSKGTMYIGYDSGQSIIWNRIYDSTSDIPAARIVESTTRKFVTADQIDLWNKMSGIASNQNWIDQIMVTKTDLIGYADIALRGQQFIVSHDTHYDGNVVTYTFIDSATGFVPTSITGIKVDSLTEKSLMSHDKTYKRILQGFMFQKYHGRGTRVAGTGVGNIAAVFIDNSKRDETFVNSSSDEIFIKDDVYKARIGANSVTNARWYDDKYKTSVLPASYKFIGDDSILIGTPDDRKIAGSSSIGIGRYMYLADNTIAIGRNISSYNIAATEDTNLTASNTAKTDGIYIGRSIRPTENKQTLIGDFTNYTTLPASFVFAYKSQDVTPNSGSSVPTMGIDKNGILYSKGFAAHPNTSVKLNVSRNIVATTLLVPIGTLTADLVAVQRQMIIQGNDIDV
jgi:hypothetical protein